MHPLSRRLAELEARSAQTDREAAEALAELQAAGRRMLASYDRLRQTIAAIEADGVTD